MSVVYWFPFYYTFKFVFLLWLSLPMFKYVLPKIRLLVRYTNSYKRRGVHLPILHGPHVRPLFCIWLDCFQPPS